MPAGLRHRCGAGSLEAVERLPDDATLEDAMERLAFLSEIEAGLADAGAGRTVSHEEVLARFALPDAATRP